MDKVIKNKRGLEVVNRPSSGYKTSSKKIFLLVTYSDQAWWCNIKRLQPQIYASQCLASLIIPLPFVLLNLQKSGKEEEKIRKFKYLENEKSFLEEIKNIFHSFWRAIIWWKNQKLIKNSGFKL